MRILSTPIAAVLLAAWPAAGQPSAGPERALLDRYCVTCHNDALRTAGLALDNLDLDRVGDHADVWEKVVGKLRAGMMPPAGRPRPAGEASGRLVAYLETELDRAAAADPDPGRSAALRRLNGTEYRNAIRDLLDLDVDVSTLLPADDSSAGFDNVSLGGLDPGRFERYLAAAAPDRPARGRRPGAVAGRRHVRRAVRPEPDRPRRRDAVRHPRRRRVRLQLPGRRRVRAAGRAGQELEHQPHRRPARAARRRDTARRRPRRGADGVAAGAAAGRDPRASSTRPPTGRPTPTSSCACRSPPVPTPSARRSSAGAASWWSATGSRS